MKKTFSAILSISILFVAACNNNEPKSGHNMNEMNKDTVQQTTVTDDAEVKTVAVTYTSIDTKAAASIKEIVDHYLHIKNALISDNGKEAAKGAEAMNEAIRETDKSLLTAEQKKAYDEIEIELKDHADHIAKHGGDIKHQRLHFSMLSEDVYGLVKTFGGGRPLYHDHCPMYNDNKGAMWISELKEVKNPYYGAEMLTCGSVEELIK